MTYLMDIYNGYSYEMSDYIFILFHDIPSFLPLKQLVSFTILLHF